MMKMILGLPTAPNFSCFSLQCAKSIWGQTDVSLLSYAFFPPSHPTSANLVPVEKMGCHACSQLFIHHMSCNGVEKEGQRISFIPHVTLEQLCWSGTTSRGQERVQPLWSAAPLVFLLSGLSRTEKVTHPSRKKIGILGSVSQS